MANIVTRASLGRLLTKEEADANFVNINQQLVTAVQQITQLSGIIAGLLGTDGNILIAKLPESPYNPTYFSDTDGDGIVDDINVAGFTALINQVTGGGSGTPQLSAPVLSLVSTSINSVTLSWTASANADGYAVQRYNGSTWVQVGTTTSALTFESTGLSESTTYQHRVIASRANGSYLPSPPSNVITANTQAGSGGGDATYVTDNSAFSLIAQDGFECLHDAPLINNNDESWSSPGDTNAGATTRLRMGDGAEISLFRKGTEKASNIGAVDNYARSNQRGVGFGPSGLYLLKEGDGIYSLPFASDQQVGVGEHVVLRYRLSDHNLLVFKWTLAGGYVPLTIPEGNFLDNINPNSYVQANLSDHPDTMFYPGQKGCVVDSTVV